MFVFDAEKYFADRYFVAMDGLGFALFFDQQLGCMRFLVVQVDDFLAFDDVVCPRGHVFVEQAVPRLQFVDLI